MNAVDDHLGPGYTSRPLPLGDDLAATLVRHPAEENTRGAILYIHGYIDYFFQTHVAEHFAGLGYDFYAVDLRAYGRSLRPQDVPYDITDLEEYFDELDAAQKFIHDEDGHQRLTVLGHSTGGLLACLWLAERRETLRVDALILNSPWLDMDEPWIVRTVGTWAMIGASKAAPHLVVPKGVSPAYGESLHADYRGEWSYNTQWKPIRGVPSYLSFIAAVRKGQLKVHKGLDLPMPILLLHSDASRLGLKKWGPEAMTADTVLDVKKMVRWGPKLGTDVAMVTIAGGLHDLFLSPAPVRKRAFAAIDLWLEAKIW